MRSTVELGKLFAKKKDEYKVKEDELKILGDEWTALENELLEAMVEEGVNSVSIEDVGLLSMKTENYMNVNSSNTPFFFAYLRESGNGALIKDHVNPRTLTSFLKEHVGTVAEELIAKAEAEGTELDEFDAKKQAVDFLISKGAANFSKKSISHRAGK